MSTLKGRRAECEELDRLVQRARRGQSSVLVLRGDAGVGKTALLEYVAERATGCRIVRAVGVQSEMELAFAGLHLVCAPMSDVAQRLPRPQRDALQVALGMEAGGTPDPFLVALAVLSLLSEMAETEPLVCLIDDAQWLDRASVQVLAFVARRLLADRIAMVFTVRGPGEAPELAGLPERVVTGLPDDEARLLLASAIPGRLDPRVGDRIVAETHGNPLALLELPRGLTPAELAGGFGLPDAGSLTSHIEKVFLRQVDVLPADARQLLLLAAAEPTGDVTLLWRAAERLGIGSDAATSAEGTGLVDLGVRVRFRHPLVRSALYRAASPRERRQAHGALAEVTDAATSGDRRAWHRAHATARLDEAVAADLDRSASRARGRGGAAAAAAFLQRAVELTPDPARRGARALAGAQAKLEAGAPAAASVLLATAELCPLDERQDAHLQRLRAQVAFALRRGSDALPLLQDAARLMVPLDAALAREAYLEALAAAVFAGRLADPGQVRDIADAALVAPIAAEPADPIDLLMRGLATSLVAGLPGGAPLLRAALGAFRQADDSDGDVNRWQWLACRIASDLFDRDTWHELANRGVRLARDAGALSILPIADSYRAGVHLHAGDFAAASALMDESVLISRSTGTAPLIYTRPLLAAYRGDEAKATVLLEASHHDALTRGQGHALSMVDCARAVLLNGRARYQEAATAAEAACEPEGLGLYGLSLVELVEAAVRSGRTELAVASLDRLVDRTQASKTSWALGLEARSRALVSEGSAAEALYAEGVRHLTGAGVDLHLARAQLVYGEWLRRENRRTDARRHLGLALDLFDRFGAEAFAERARRELLATGEFARRRTTTARATLTPQEAQIAWLAGDGLSNPEIGEHLFISPRTAEYHLRKVFAKLDIGSRKELRSALAGVPGLPAGDPH